MNAKTILNYAVSIALWLALLFFSFVTIRALFGQSLRTVMIFAPWILIIVLTMRIRVYAGRLHLADAAPEHPTQNPPMSSTTQQKTVGLNYRQCLALAALKAQNEIMGGWVFLATGADTQALHQMTKCGFVQMRHAEDGLTQLAITALGIQELRRAVMVYNGEPAGRPVEVKL